MIASTEHEQWPKKKKKQVKVCFIIPGKKCDEFELKKILGLIEFALLI